VLITSRRPARFLILGLLVIVLLFAVAHFVGLAVAGERIRDVVNLNAENNPSTWFSSALHLINAFLLGVIALVAERNRWRWALLAVLVLGVSMDETAQLHERLSEFLHVALSTSGPLRFAWVIPAAGLVIVVAALSTRMLMRVPGGGLVLAGVAVFLIGAMGLEMIEADRSDAIGHVDTVMLVLCGVEELLEMIGAILAMAGLMRTVAATGLTVARLYPADLNTPVTRNRSDLRLHP
jgi:hypothetical protein